MSFETTILERLRALNELVNRVLVNAKTNEELPVQSVLQLNSLLRVSREGTSETITVEQIIAAAQNYEAFVENEYLNISDLLANQNQQTSGRVQFVTDARSDNEITAGDPVYFAYYEYLGTTNGIITVDYRQLSSNEVMALLVSDAFNVFTVNGQQITPSTTAPDSTVEVQYESTGNTVTDILFDVPFSKYLVEMTSLNATNDFAIEIYNKTKKRFIAKGGVTFTLVNSDYCRVSLGGTNIPNTALNTGDVLEVGFSMYKNVEGGASSPISKLYDDENKITFIDIWSYYDELAPLTSGNVFIDRVNAKKGAISEIDYDRHVPNIVLSTGEFYYSNGIKPSSTAYNIISFQEKGAYVLVSVNVFEYLNQAQNLAITPQDTALLITFDVVESAENYDVYLGTTDVFENASLQGNTENLFYDTGPGLINGSLYYMWLVAKGDGFKDSIPQIISGTPAPPITSNTFIDGKGVSITTESALATLLGISVNDIEGFSVNNNNIECQINTGYSLPIDLFDDDSEITRFEDSAAKCTDASAANVFENADLLVSVLMTANLSQSPDVNGCALLYKLDFPNSTGSLNAVRNCPELYIINGQFTSIGFQGIQGNNKLSTFYSESITSLGNNAMYDIGNEMYIGLPNVTSLPNNAFYLLDNVNSVVRLKGVISIDGTRAFFRSDAKRIYLGNCTSIGDPATDRETFTQNASIFPLKIYVDPVLMTNNSGGLDADLVTAQANGSTIVSCINKTPPEAITDLAATVLSGNSVVLSFSLPNTTNALEYYEVWVNKNDDKGWQVLRPTDEITTSGDTVSDVALGYLLKLYACDILGNRSPESNPITVVAT